MAKQSINVGAAANDRQGDSLRSAFQKVNANFTELYSQLGLDELPLNLGAFEFTGSTITTTDSSSIIIDNSVTITSDLTVGGDILPSGNLAADIGSATNRFRDLYLSGNTINFGGTTLSVVESELRLNGIKIPTPSDVTNEINDAIIDVVAGSVDLTPYATVASLSDVATSGDYDDLINRPTIPVDVSDLTDIGGLLTHFSGSYTDLSNTPTIPIDISELTDTGNLLFDGDYNSLSNQPTIPLDIADLTDTGNLLIGVSAAGSTGQIQINSDGEFSASSELTFDPSTRRMVLGGSTLGIVETLQVVGHAGGVLYLSSATEGGTESTHIALSSTSGISTTMYGNVSFGSGSSVNFTNATVSGLSVSAQGFTYTELGGTSEIGVTADVFDFGDGKTIDMQNSTVLFTGSTVSGLDVGASVSISDTPPGSPSAGDLWWESTTGRLKIYYSDGDTSQWVDAHYPSSVSDNPFDQDLNTTDNPQFNRVGLTAGEINVTAGTDFNLYVTPDGETVHNLNFTTAGNLIIGALSVYDGAVETDTGNTLGLYGGANVAITTDGGNYEWNFDANGDLGFPGSPGTNYVIGESEGGLYISSSHELFLVTDEGSTDKIFRFDTNGDLRLPGSMELQGSIRSENNIDIEINLSDSTLRRWSFGEDGSLTLPSGVVMTEGGLLGAGDLKITTTEPGVGTTYDFSIGASDGIWALRFPDGTRQETALQAETVAQTGYRLQFDTDIYANETGGATDANETGVQFASNTVVRELFDLTPPATSTSARVYVDPLATEGQPDPNILEVTIVSGAPLAINMSVYAIVNGTPQYLGRIDSQVDATTFRLMAAPLTEEVPIGTEFEFYGPGNFIEYAPINPITIFWDSGEETVVTAGATNSPYGVNVFLVTAEDQTALTYPIEVATDNYEPAEFSHVIDSDNNFKITTRANDFIINSNEGPLIIRNATSDYIFEGGTLTVPGTINIDGVGSVVGFATGADNFIGLEGQANWGVALRATDSELDSKNWLFGTNGVLTLPGEGVIRSNNDTVILQSYDPAFNVGKGIRIGTNGSVYFELGDDPAYLTLGQDTGDVKITANSNLDITSSNYVTIESTGGGQIMLGANQLVGGNNGAVVLGHSGNSVNLYGGKLRIQNTSVPTTSLGTTGDVAGLVAFDATYIYYCTQDFAGTVINMTSISSSGILRAYIIMYDSNTGWTSADLTGYTVTGPGSYTGTVTGPSQDQGGGLWYIPVSPDVTQAMGTYTFTSPGGDIWKRVAWSGDTW